MPPHDATVVASRRVDCSFYNPHIVSRSPAGGSKAGVVQNLGNSAARSAPCGRWWNASLAAIFTPWRIQKDVAAPFGKARPVVARCDDSTIVPVRISDELPASKFWTPDRQLATNCRKQGAPRRFRNLRQRHQCDKLSYRWGSLRRPHPGAMGS